MKLWTSLLCMLIILHCSYAPPVTPDKSKEQTEDGDLEEVMEYHRYLKEVVQALESDPEFRERLEKADENDVKSGKIAEQLDFVNHNVRTKLDEIKRREVDRLRHLVTKKFELDNKLDAYSGKVPTNEHLDHENPHTFEIEDLKKLIKKTTEDIEAADKKRKEEFKEYEMEKEFEKKQKIEAMDEAQKKEFEKKIKEEEEAKKHHQPLHHPGSKQQLEEVWEKQDHMESQQFDPKVFFMTHDVDGNGVWDPNEVKALFIKELDKVYGPNGPNKDMHERAEEMERMREHVFKENDKNGDGLIDFNEFLMETQRADFNQDEGWKPVEENEIYSQSEYEAFEKERHEQLAYLQQRGLVDAYGRPIPGAHHQIQQALHQYQTYKMQQQQFQQMPQFQAPPPGYQQGHPQGYQQPPQGYQQHPQGYQQPPQGYQQPPQGYQQPPQGYQPPLPQQGYQQPPQSQFQGQQPPQGQFQGQQPQQGQLQGQQPPQGQFQGQQPPQGQFQQQQGQQTPQGQSQGQQPSPGQFQAQPPQQVQGQPQPPANVGQVPTQNAAVQGQGQSPPAQGQSQTQGQVPVQGQPPVAQTQNQVPPAGVGGTQ